MSTADTLAAANVEVKAIRPAAFGAARVVAAVVVLAVYWVFSFQIYPFEITPDAKAKPLALQPGDWPRFRGPDGDSQVRGVAIATAWNAQPPKQIWRHPVGPAFSSMIIVDGRLFTQEQRGDSEAVVCYDAATGQEIWAHLDKGRFSEDLSGAGPRATPTFADGRIYTLGGFGLANCLDAASGRAIWSRLLYAPKTNQATAANGAESNGASAKGRILLGGVSNSPLVVGNAAFFFTGVPPDKELLALSVADGKPKWTAATGDSAKSYSSPMLFSLAGQSFVVMSTNKGLAAVDPANGRSVWQFTATDWQNEPSVPIGQPQAVGDGRFVIHSPSGLTLIQVSQRDGKWTTTQLWQSDLLKPSLNDFVVQDGAIYGFDDGIFCCLDLKTGNRRWKEGRYGHGQVLLLVKQKLLLVLSETGEAVLLAANSDRQEELGRTQLISGKTWNHPIICRGRLYVRNGEEMACYELPLATANP